LSDDQGEKTEEATQARKDEYRSRGQVAQSRELATALFLLASAGCLYIFGRFFFQQIYEVFQFTFGPNLVQITRGDGDLREVLVFIGQKLVILLAPVFGVATIIAIGSTVLQVGLLNVEDAISMNVDKINPIEGFKRVFSLKAIVEAFKAIIKLAVISAIVYSLVKGELIKLPYISQYGIQEVFQYTAGIAFKILGSIGVIMLLIAVADYFFQRWELNKQMMMTKEEVKQEHKSREGDPLIKSRIRRIQREMSSRRMMDAVPKADVIITNPTHLAIALRYSDDLPAPQVIAKGADLVADKIREIAKNKNIPIVENKPLARTLFKTVKVGNVIPRELFVAVAEVLSYVYKLKRRRK
jgi:flagellar biosynthetic protein FlhB